MFYVTSRFLYVHPGTYDDRGRETRLRQDGTLAGGKVFRLGCVHYSDTDPSFFIFRTASALHRLSQKQSAGSKKERVRAGFVEVQGRNTV